MDQKIIITERHSDRTVYRRAWQPLKKDGTPAKRIARRTLKCLIIYDDGSYRFYDATGVLARERIVESRRAAERNVDHMMTRSMLRAVIAAELKARP